MILPYASDNLPTRRPLATLTLLAATFALTLLAVGYGWRQARIPRTSLCFPWSASCQIIFSRLPSSRIRCFTTKLGHFLINAFYLGTFGAGMEAALGRLRYLLLYFVGGAVGGALQWLV